MSQRFAKVAQKLGDAIGVVAVNPLHLANMFSAGTLEEHPVGFQLCNVGEASEAVYLLLNGTVEVSKPDKGGTMRPLAVLNGPAMLGHMGVIDGSVRSATCVVTGDRAAKVIHIKAERFKRLLRRQDATGSASRHLVLASLIRQLGNTNRTVSALIDGQSDKTAVEPGTLQREGLDSRDLAFLEAVLRGWSLPPDTELD